MKKAKRGFAFILSIFLLVGCVEPAASAAAFSQLKSSGEPVVYGIAQSGTCGETATWELSDEGVLTISGSGAISDTGEHDMPWKDLRNDITSIVIDEGITRIGNWVFHSCTEAISVSLPSTLKEIGEQSFRSCSEITQVMLPSGLESIGGGAFYYCDSLTSLTIPGGVENFTDAFGSSGLRTLVLEEGIDSVDDYAFNGCRHLKNVTLPSTVKRIGKYAFSNCFSLANLDIPADVTELGEGALSYTALSEFEFPEGVNSVEPYVLSGTDITSIVIPDRFTEIGDYAFSNCKQLKNITLSKNLTDIGTRAFAYTALTQVDLPDGLETLGDSAFYDCNELTSVTMTDSVQVMEKGVFSDCDNLRSVVLSDYITEIGHQTFSLCKKLESVNIPASLKTIGNDAFQYCESLRSVTLPEGVERIGSLAFRGCGALEAVVLPASVKEISGGYGNDAAFNNCGNVTLYVKAGSYAQQYAIDGNLRYELLAEGKRVTLDVLDSSGTLLEKGYSVRWYQENRLIATGNSVVVDLDTQVLTYEVVLDEHMLFQYQVPAMQQVELVENITQADCQLQALPVVTLIGTVETVGGTPLGGAKISVSQSAKEYKGNKKTLQTDSLGGFTVELPTLNTTVTVEAEGYYTRSRTMALLGGEDASNNMGVIALTPIPDTRVELSFSMKNAVEEGTFSGTTKLETGNGLSVSVYNVTQNQPIDEVVFQYPYLVLGDAVSEGETVRITATDTWGQMTAEPVELELTGDNWNTEIIFTENGSLSAVLTGDFSKRAMIFDDAGQLVETAVVEGQFFHSSRLPEGTYQAVFLEKTTQMSAVPQLSYLSDLGLVSGEDYLLREVSIQNGKITNLGTFMVPALEPGKLSFVNGENTSVSVNKSLVAAGQPVTVRVAYEIKEEYGSSGETLVIELPENCGIVAGSVVVNGKTVTYTETGNTVSIPTGYSSGTVLFYVSPSASGEFAVTCGLQFESSHSGKVLQPLGAGYFRATAMELQVLDRTARDTVVVSGKTAANGNVEIYDGSRLAATATANAAGTWAAKVLLQPRYQFEVHNLSAKVTTSDGTYLSDTARVTYDANYIDLKSITMINTAHPPTNLNPVEYRTEMVVDEYLGKSFYYRWDPAHPVFTFSVEFEENNPQRISDVYLVAVNAEGAQTLLPCQYQENTEAWTTSGTFDTVESLPVSLSVRYVCEGEPCVYGSEQVLEALIEDAQEIQEAVQETVEKQLEDLSVGEISVNEAGVISLPIYNNGTAIGSITTQEVDYSQFDLENWEELGCLWYEMEDGTEYYTRTELSSSDPLTIVQWTAYPADEILTKDTVTLEPPAEQSQFLKTSQEASLAAPSAYSFTADVGDLTSITSTIAECLPGWAGDLATVINTVGELNILKQSVESYQSIFDTDSDTTWNLLNARCDDGTLRLNSEDYEKFGQLWAEIDQQAINYPMEVSGMYIASFITEKVMGKLASKSVPKELSDLFDKKLEQLPDEVILSCMSSYRQILKKMGVVKKGAFKGQVIRRVTGTTMGLVEFGANVNEGILTDHLMDSLAGSLDAMEYMHNRFTEIHLQYEYLQDAIMKQYRKCGGGGGDGSGGNGGNGGNGNGSSTDSDQKRQGQNSLTLDLTPGIDPSGFVCEAVPSNVLEGVTVTLYSSDGNPSDGNQKWNAEKYDQENPLITNTDGVYAWDVPAGKWQVKFEKDGYETAYSSVLDVPPPQTNVNVSLVSKEAPQIKSVSAYPEGVRVEFTQYMDIESVEEKLRVSVGVDSISGTVTPENAEASLNDPSVKYASVFFFTFDKSLDSGSVQVTASGAKNYAGKAVTEEGQDITASIEPQPTGITVKNQVFVATGGSVELTLQVFPKKAGANKTIAISSSTPSLLGVTDSTLKTDSNGKAMVQVTGKLPGEGQLTFTLTNTSLLAKTKVWVGSNSGEEPAVCQTVTANYVSGSTLKSGTQILLTSATEGASIYYTLDKTCPCDENNPSRRQYTGPFAVTEDTYVIAYAVKEGFADSETSHFSYTVQEETPPVVGPGPGPDTGDTLPFTDVPQGAWYRAAVEYVYLHDLMRGVSETEFSPNTRLTRGQVAQILYNLEGKPLVSKKTTFTDVQGHWASGPIAWAEDAGVVAGYQNKTYRPENYVTREELAQMLYNYAKYKKYDLAALGDLDQFPDGDQVQGWAEDAVAWANGNGLINGFEDDTLRPQGDSTRAQAASILMNFDQNVVE